MEELEAIEPHVIKIQRTFRSFLNRRIFRYYRDLIRFREKGEPGQLLRYINPPEAGLVDGASSVHIRFRLGGYKFPPNVYYKVYVHQPVVDINAFAPRDYTRYKRAMPERKHNKGYEADSTEDDKDGWYVRYENNGWRPIAEAFLREYDPVTAETGAKVQIDYHHDRLVRRKDVEKKRRQKKLEWMQKMYQLGKTLESEKTGGESSLSQGAKVVNGGIEEGDGELEDVDSLINWAESLDFEQYAEEWQTLATSAKSDPFTTVQIATLEESGVSRDGTGTQRSYESFGSND